MATRYPSKVDTWLAALMLAAFVVMVVGVQGAYRDGEYVGVLVGFGAICLVVALTWPTDYTLFQREIVVRSGLIRYRIPYSSIVEVKPSRAMWSAPAWSLDRLLIRCGKKMFLISPVDKWGFMADVAKHDPGLVYEDGVVRRV